MCMTFEWLDEGRGERERASETAERKISFECLSHITSTSIRYTTTFCLTVETKERRVLYRK